MIASTVNSRALSIYVHIIDRHDLSTDRPLAVLFSKVILRRIIQNYISVMAIMGSSVKQLSARELHCIEDSAIK
jgi:hypothetical protein